jgi:hypothetical protein
MAADIAQIDRRLLRFGSLLINTLRATQKNLSTPPFGHQADLPCDNRVHRLRVTVCRTDLKPEFGARPEAAVLSEG